MSSGNHLIGPYEVLGSLGRGGMAEVFKVEHRHLGQIRALKVLLPKISARPEIVERLLAEARAMGRLRHPAIVEVFDCDVLEDGTAFIAMEYLRGEPLRLWVERTGKLAAHPMLAAAIVGRVAEGLAFAHAQGVVHRDLKPENVLLVPNEARANRFTVKILDFGVAKMLRDERPRTPTLEGCVIGTPVCMAPEQWQPGGGTDHRADIYALGCLLFDLLCGRPPFPDNDDLALMRAHLDRPAPALRTIEAGLPAGFEQLISRMLAKSPDDRPQTVEEVLAALESLIGRKRRRWGELLQTPPDRPVLVQPTVTASRPALVPLGRSLARRASAGPSRWGRTGRDPRTRMAMLACLGMVGAAGLVGAVLLLTKPGEAKSPPADLDRPQIVATPMPPRSSQPVFSAQVTSAQVTSAQVTSADVTSAQAASPPAATPPDSPTVDVRPDRPRPTRPTPGRSANIYQAVDD
jgi:serine/threonine protein kinase